MAIVKHNKLIETSYKMNSREQFFVLYLISKISQNDADFREYKMHYSEIERILNFDGKRRIANKNEVFSLMDRLNSVPIMYEKGTIVGKSVWLQHMEHDTETDEFSFSLSEKLRDYLLQLKEHFTQYNISNIVYLNSNAIRLYEVLKRYQFLGECTLEVEKIKFFLGIEGKYPKFYEFKRWVLIPSQTEIEKYSDIRFEFMPARKKGKSIISLKFFIYENTPQSIPDNIRFLTGESRPKGKNATALQRKIDQLNYSQWMAFQFLSHLGVNKTFVLEKVLMDAKVNYEPLIGFEDVYMKILWKFLNEKSNADSKAAAFVDWWKKGKLTEDNLHARMVEVVLKKKNEMSNSERDRREATKEMNKAEYGVYLEKEQNEIRAAANGVGEDVQFGTKVKSKGFNIDVFKNQFPEQYMSAMEEVKNEYVKAFESLNQKVDFGKYQNAIEDKVRFKCKEWWEKQAIKKVS